VHLRLNGVVSTRFNHKKGNFLAERTINLFFCIPNTGLFPTKNNKSSSHHVTMHRQTMLLLKQSSDMSTKQAQSKAAGRRVISARFLVRNHVLIALLLSLLSCNTAWSFAPNILSPSLTTASKRPYAFLAVNNIPPKRKVTVSMGSPTDKSASIVSTEGTCLAMSKGIPSKRAASEVLSASRDGYDQDFASKGKNFGRKTCFPVTGIIASAPILGFANDVSARVDLAQVRS
jgi:hypothetical protein